MHLATQDSFSAHCDDESEMNRARAVRWTARCAVRDARAVSRVGRQVDQVRSSQCVFRRRHAQRTPNVQAKPTAAGQVA